MNKKIKMLLSLGAVSVMTAASTLPINAMSNKTYAKCTNVNVYMNINGVKYKLPSSITCPVIPTKPGCSGTTPEVKPEEKPDVTPDTKPEVKPEEKPDVTPDTKPEVKPEEKPDVTPDTKPEVKPEENFSAYQQEVLRLVNIERQKVGVAPLALDSSLSNVATVKSQDMIDKNYFDHNSPTYGSPFDMMKQFGISYRAAGENIAYGQDSPAEVMNSWMNSSGHRKNILSADFTHLGVGVAKKSNGTIYWTQMFIGK